MVQDLLRRFAQIAGTTCALSLVLGSAHAIDLRKDLSEAQFAAAGLSKLDGAELDELQRLINSEPSQSTSAAPIMQVPASAATENSPDWRPAPADSERTTIETEVTEAFKGLFGTTKIVLANGQVWQQTDGATFDRRLRDNRVRIKPGILGRWRLQFRENNLSFPVKRVK